MNIKEKIEEIVHRIQSDKNLQKQFQTEPVKAIEGLLGIDLPDDTVKQLVEGVKLKLAGDNIAGAVEKFKGLFGK